ncbi:hypothetical protein GCK72_022317 [Caenorhabditis remanei]|uniref:Uncharacterized protein n=1 Tax=Caenorhabditis remanei TaxID=31234 RepID=A0A6A5FTF1_CAERE|nr:hypothetical protein GCK72_022317 [Caenorhabditis remanei]KAF1745870.1 hypothetical protein GCK72_022317 [Caenorhabditis remanei]
MLDEKVIKSRERLLEPEKALEILKYAETCRVYCKEIHYFMSLHLTYRCEKVFKCSRFGRKSPDVAANRVQMQRPHIQKLKRFQCINCLRVFASVASVGSIVFENQAEHSKHMISNFMASFGGESRTKKHSDEQRFLTTSLKREVQESDGCFYPLLRILLCSRLKTTMIRFVLILTIRRTTTVSPNR